MAGRSNATQLRVLCVQNNAKITISYFCWFLLNEIAYSRIVRDADDRYVDSNREMAWLNNG